MNKEEALKEIERLRAYIEQEDKKPEIDWEHIAKQGYLVGVSNASQETADMHAAKGFSLHQLNNVYSNENFPFHAEGTSCKYIAFCYNRGVLAPWFGGECPYPEGAIGQVVYRNGSRSSADRNLSYKGMPPEEWQHDGSRSDIVECIWLYGGEG